MDVFEKYGEWTRKRLENEFKRAHPEGAGFCLPYSHKGIEVGTQGYVLELLRKTSNTELGKRAIKIQSVLGGFAALVAGILAKYN